MKLDSTATDLVYSTYLGGSDLDWASAIAVDADGNAYVTGQAASSNFPTTPGAFQLFRNGPARDAFIAKIVDVASPIGALAPCRPAL